MKKTFKKMMALVIAAVMVVAMGLPAFATSTNPTQSHTITITNQDQYVPHTYEGYQVFKGDLSADGKTLSNIVWGNGVDGTALLADLKASSVAALIGDDPLTSAVETDVNIFGSCQDAKDVAKVMDKYNTTAAVAEAFADLVADSLVTANKIAFATDAADTTGKTYKATVPSDGYYFIQDITQNLTHQDENGEDSQSDTLSKYILQVVKDVEVEAKDTGVPVDKKILGATATDPKVKEGSKNIGDVIDFEVTSKVPDTSRFASYTFNMNDTLDAGLTYFDSLAVKIGTDTLTVGTDYTVTVTNADNSAFTTPNTVATAVETTGGQKIKVSFLNMKQYGSTAGNPGKDIVITYKAVLNKNATMGVVPNKNEVYFEYSKNPNDETVTGQTPKSITETYSTALDVLKTDGNNKALEGAIFKLHGSTYNFMVVNGEKYEPTTYTARTGETIDNTKTYWKLIDGAFTDKDPSTLADKSQYVTPTTTTYYKVTMVNVVESTGTGTLDVEAVSDANGKMSFTGLKPGTYTLSEIAAPDGFNKIVGDSNVEITWDPTNGWQLGNDTSAGWVENIDTNNKGVGTFHITIVNESGSVLPSTGGIGTTIFYILGAILVLGAGILLVTRRRMNAN